MVAQRRGAVIRPLSSGSWPGRLDAVSKKRDETVEFDPSAVLARLSRERATTVPIDADEVKKAAAESIEAPDPYPRRARPRETPAVIRREQPTRAFQTVLKPNEPFVEIAVVGGGDIYALPLRSMSASGLAVAAAREQAPLLQPGVTAVVNVAVAGDDGRVELRLHARVEHRREASKTVEGGIRLQWIADDARVAASIRRLVAAWLTRAT